MPPGGRPRSLTDRLNVFGFLGGDDIASQSGGAGSGNFGIQDQQAALRWVRDHIAAFGGNGSDVTIFGESAGGNSVWNHLVRPASFGLYTKAIIESGAYDDGALTLKEAEAGYQSLAKKHGCKNIDPAKAVACLRSVPADELAPKTMAGVWGPVVDGITVTETPAALVERGSWNSRVPIIIGSNRDEAACG